MLTVMPGLATATVAPETKWSPVKVTTTVAPWVPVEGLTEVTVGAGAVTLKLAALLVPPAVVTVTLVAPTEAPAATVKVAVICVWLTTLTLLTVTPGLATATVAPLVKFVPVSVTGTLPPCGALPGVVEVNVGADGLVTANGTELLLPLEVDTITSTVSITALLAITSVAVAWVKLTTLTLVPVTYGLSVETRALLRK